MDLVSEGGQQLDIFGYSQNDERAKVLMETMDKMNKN